MTKNQSQTSNIFRTVRILAVINSFKKFEIYLVSLIRKVFLKALQLSAIVPVVSRLFHLIILVGKKDCLKKNYAKL